MKIIKTPLEGLLEIYPRVYEDERGYFFEAFREDILAENGIETIWVQQNQSFSKKGTIRGLHFQKHPFGQAKLARVVQGVVLDVVVDLRKNSPTYGKSFSKILNVKEHNMLYVPEGFAHGFSVMEDAVFSYKCSNYFNKECEGGILWNDPEIDIDWQVSEPILSEKDKQWPTLKEFTKTSEGGI
jgi:dTDP-4-dehydrorhamnose 3,5-epimerase